MQEKHLDESSVSFRIFGFGEQSKIIINQINSLKYTGVEAFNHKDTHIIPEEDKMVILLDPTNKEIQYFSKLFYKAGILTLIISSRDYSKIKDCFDSCTKIPQIKFFQTVKGILDPLFHFGPISFDFNDIKLTLKDSGNFLIKTFESDKPANCLDRLIDELSNELKDNRYIENLSIILTYNKNCTRHLLGSEIKKFQNFLKSFPGNINIIWGVQNDEKLKSDQIKLIIIFSGRNLIPI